MNFEVLLKQNGLKITSLRVQILEILQNSNEPLSYDKILSKISANKTTFYRCMDAFEEHGLVIKSESNRKNFYELAGEAKAYFVCDICHKRTNIDMPNLKQTHVKSVVVKGVCDDCF
ncbi:MAG: Fur family transcriptional regulator [Campylobacter sp.]